MKTVPYCILILGAFSLLNWSCGGPLTPSSPSQPEKKEKLKEAIEEVIEEDPNRDLEKEFIEKLKEKGLNHISREDALAAIGQLDQQIQEFQVKITSLHDELTHNSNKRSDLNDSYVVHDRIAIGFLTAGGSLTAVQTAYFLSTLVKKLNHTQEAKNLGKRYFKKYLAEMSDRLAERLSQRSAQSAAEIADILRKYYQSELIKDPAKLVSTLKKKGIEISTEGLAELEGRKLKKFSVKRLKRKGVGALALATVTTLGYLFFDGKASGYEESKLHLLLTKEERDQRLEEIDNYNRHVNDKNKRLRMIMNIYGIKDIEEARTFYRDMQKDQIENDPDYRGSFEVSP